MTKLSSFKVLGLAVAGAALVPAGHARAQTLTTLYNFGGGADGGFAIAGLVLSSDGSTLYGTTPLRGAYDFGTVFSVPAGGGSDTVLYHFSGGADGGFPAAGLVFSRDGNTLYGTTSYGGSQGYGTVFSVNVAERTETVLYNFGGFPDGGYGGTDGLNQLSSDGSTLYGTTPIKRHVQRRHSLQRPRRCP